MLDDDSCLGRVVCVLTGGTVNREFLISFLEQYPDCFLLCVDGGLRHAYELGLKVDAIVGDFDTIDPDIIEYYRTKTQVPIRTFRPEKDSTDSEIAIQFAIQLKPECIYMIGGFGTRMDHTLGNIHILKKALDVGIKAYLVDEYNRLSMLGTPITLDKSNLYGNYISFIPFTQKIENLTLKGFKYPLENRTMVYGESLGISNEVVEEKAYVHFTSGILLMIEARDEIQ